MKNIRTRRLSREKKIRPQMRDQDVRLTKISPRDDAELDFFKKRSLISSVIIITFFAVLVSRLWFSTDPAGRNVRQQGGQ